MKQRSVQFWVVVVVFMMGVCMLFLFNWPLNKMIKYTFPLDKETAQLFADKRVKSEFVGAKLVRSSESIENKVGLNGWVFIYESNGVFGLNHHSAAIMVDINTAETLVQRAY